MPQIRKKFVYLLFLKLPTYTIFAPLNYFNCDNHDCK